MKLGPAGPAHSSHSHLFFCSLNLALVSLSSCKLNMDSSVYVSTNLGCFSIRAASELAALATAVAKCCCYGHRMLKNSLDHQAVAIAAKSNTALVSWVILHLNVLLFILNWLMVSRRVFLKRLFYSLTI